MKKLLTSLCATTVLFPMLWAQDLNNPFDAAADLDGLDIEGSVEIEAGMAQAGAGSMRVGPGGTVEIPLQSGDQGGLVEFYVYDDLTVPDDPTARRRGPLFGIAHSDGTQLAIGGMYAPYLSSDGMNHVSTMLDPTGQGIWYEKIQFLTGAARQEGWNKWTFDMDPIAGLSIYRNDELVDSFTWESAPIPGFNSLIILGDTNEGTTQTIWVDELSFEEKGAMKINPDGTPIEGGGQVDLAELEFDSETDLEGASVTGAFIDTDFMMDGAGSLRVEPGAAVYMQLSDTEQAAHVTFYHYDDMSVPGDASVRRAGPRFGLRKSNGTALTVGSTYAPYLSGQSNYVSNWYDTSGIATWFQVQHLSQAKRSEGWHKWVFDLDPELGLTLYIDNIEINAFNWADAPLTQFTQLVFLGDVADADGQTIWIDNVTVEFKGPSSIDPGNVDPIAPPTDPEYTGPEIGLVGDLENVHPRLLFTEADLPAMREFFNKDGNVHDNILGSTANTADSWNINNNWIGNATEGQRVGLWYLPTLALQYVLSGDQRWLDGAIDIMTAVVQQPTWESGGEEDAGMGAGNVMGGMAIAYDWLYHDLPEGLRDAVKDALWTHARRMYYGGHMVGSYWTGDPQNNHRYHRDYGFVLATIASYEGEEHQDWLLSKVIDELKYIMDWLPEDGSNHEGIGYHIFGLPHLYSIMQASDVALGTQYRDHGYFENMGYFWAMSMTPDRNSFLGYGDYSAGLGSYNYPMYAAAAYHGQQPLMVLYDFVRSKVSNAFPYAWMGLIGYTGHEPGSITPLPKAMYFPDIEAAYMRDKVATAGVAARFKCGPMGGHSMNAYRDANNFKYVNVAHDDPDANSFTLWHNGGFLAPTDGYSYSKKSANHNTILVDGKGQEHPGRAEGGQWSQPGGDSMDQLAYFTNWKDAGSIVLAEGEAADYYVAGSLDRYRRDFIWNEGKYVLILDDIRASGAAVDISWLLQSPELTEVDAAAGKFQLAHSNASSVVEIVASSEYNAAIGESPADSRNDSLGYDQLSLEFDGITGIQVTSLHNPWGGAPTIELDLVDADNAVITVTGDGYVDTWTWQAAVDDSSAASLELVSTDGQTFNSTPDAWTEFFPGWNTRMGGGDWWKTESVDYIYPDMYPWILHANLGWLYCSNSSDWGMFFWAVNTGDWLWTSDVYYPWYYDYGAGEWKKV